MPLINNQRRQTDSKTIDGISDELPVGPDENALSNVPACSSSTASIYHFTARTTRGEWEKLSDFKEIVNAYSEDTQKYIDRLAGSPNNLDALKHLTSDQLRECRDAYTGKIAQIPVLLENNLYDLQTLLDCWECCNFRIDPVNKKEFYLSDIKPADAVYSRIQEVIKIEEQRQEEKYSAQAKTFIASAERARQQQRSKCVML